MKKRLFVAFNFNDRETAVLGNIVASLREINPLRDISWTPAHQFHATLLFLGDVEESLIPALTQSLDEKVTGMSSFTCLTSDRLNAFPSLDRPRVIYVPYEEKSGTLAEVTAAIDAAAYPHGFRRDVPLEPHITMGRIRDGKTCVLPQTISTVACTVQSIDLMDSNVKAGECIYTALARFPLL